ncbi:C-type lectin domain family 4 member F-like [Onychostoma macrolepis]|uniref:C-type lectin domain family 4 member F-like n=1 Tax=Onychostoma macrolepis TaxID=369639 RepID=UPI00272D5FE9|nr:C-type lectin domain family 4 member F-like [Onychostoma macrolepis]
MPSDLTSFTLTYAVLAESPHTNRYAYGNSDDLDWDPKDTADASEHTFSSRKEKDPSCKAVLLAVLSISLLVALCVLGILYSKLLRSSDLLKEQSRNAAVDIEIQEQNATDGTFGRRKYYYFSSEKLNWMESRDYCMKTGGQLVTITGKDDQNNLASKLNEPHWIGLHDLYTEGHWMWVDNTTLSGEAFWHKRTTGLSEPDNWTQEDSDGEDCACLESEWFDASCSQLKMFICEK